MKKIFLSLSLLSFLLFVSFKQVFAASKHNPDIAIALGGNAWVTKKDPKAREKIATNGLSNWSNPGSVVSIYFKVENAGEIDAVLTHEGCLGE